MAKAIQPRVAELFSGELTLDKGPVRLLFLQQPWARQQGKSPFSDPGGAGSNPPLEDGTRGGSQHAGYAAVMASVNTVKANPRLTCIDTSAD